MQAVVFPTVSKGSLKKVHFMLQFHDPSRLPGPVLHPPTASLLVCVAAEYFSQSRVCSSGIYMLKSWSRKKVVWCTVVVRKSILDAVSWEYFAFPAVVLRLLGPFPCRLCLLHLLPCWCCYGEYIYYPLTHLWNAHKDSQPHNALLANSLLTQTWL